MMNLLRSQYRLQDWSKKLETNKLVDLRMLETKRFMEKFLLTLGKKTRQSIMMIISDCSR